MYKIIQQLGILIDLLFNYCFLFGHLHSFILEKKEGYPDRDNMSIWKEKYLYALLFHYN